MLLLFQLQFTTSAFFWLIGCLALGFAYAFLLYRSQNHLSKTLRNSLFALRTLAVATLAFLLFAPPVKTSTKTLEKPLIIIAQDNSASIGISKAKDFNPQAYSSQLKQLEKTLSADYEVRSFNFGADVKEGLNFKYDAKLTDISSLFKAVNDQFSNRNIGAVILATDGIYNKGGNPQYESKNLQAPVYAVALGDTIPKRDILISNVNYNAIAYLDNQFQVEVSAEAWQSKGELSKLTVSDNSGIVFSKSVSVPANEYRLSIPVILQAKRKGIQKFTISLSPISNELSTTNNTQTIFVEVIDGKQNVLIIANAPHPDLTTVKQAIEGNKNYAVKVAFADNVDNAELDKAGLIILHQLPSLTNAAQAILQRVSAKPLFFILGAQSNTSGFSSAQSLLNITSSGAIQEVIAKPQADFYAFTLSEASRLKLQNFAPLYAPFGNYALKGPAYVLLGQQVGKVATAMPLLVFGDERGRKVGVLAGEGIWRWRLEEFQESSSHDAVNELLGKTIQYLSTRDDKRKFKVYPAKKSFDENEHIMLNAELYNDAYELVNKPDVSISLKNKAGENYTYQFSKSGNAYMLDAGVLPSGEYGYDAETHLGSKKYSANGSFVISQQQTEFQQTTANHQLLYAMAKQHGGQLIYPNQLNELAQLIKTNENIKTISYEGRKYEDLINLKTIFFLILGLLAMEWFSRKRNGEI